VPLRWLAWLTLATVLAGCAEGSVRWQPLDQDPQARAGAHRGTMIGRGGPLQTD
jgi:hypothetical protein